jgi:uncharacterized Tic20 family protein
MNEKPVNDKSWAMLCHLSSLSWFLFALLGIPIPFVEIIIPLIIWSVKREESEFIDFHGQESLNFHISWTLYRLVLFLIGIAIFFAIANTFLASVDNPDSTAIAKVIMIALIYFTIFITLSSIGTIFVIIASVKANQGNYYRYPLTIRFLR